MTPKQAQAQALAAKGLSQRQIGERLGISPSSVRQRLNPEWHAAKQRQHKAAHPEVVERSRAVASLKRGAASPKPKGT